MAIASARGAAACSASGEVAGTASGFLVLLWRSNVRGQGHRLTLLDNCLQGTGDSLSGSTPVSFEKDE